MSPSQFSSQNSPLNSPVKNPTHLPANLTGMPTRQANSSASTGSIGWWINRRSPDDLARLALHKQREIGEVKISPSRAFRVLNSQPEFIVCILALILIDLVIIQLPEYELASDRQSILPLKSARPVACSAVPQLVAPGWDGGRVLY
jgi:hypothetical protein